MPHSVGHFVVDSLLRKLYHLGWTAVKYDYDKYLILIDQERK